MGLTDIILAADTAILDRFQRITDVAAAKYGYTKYDLAVGCQKTGGAALLASSLYDALQDSLLSNYAAVAFSASLSLFAVFVYNHAKTYREIEQREVQQMMSGAVPVVVQDRKGLYLGALGTLGVGFTLYTVLNGGTYSADSLQMLDASERDSLNTSARGFLAVGIYNLSCAKYFEGTTMVLPKTKKLHEWVYEKLRSFIQGQLV